MKEQHPRLSHVISLPALLVARVESPCSAECQEHAEPSVPEPGLVVQRPKIRRADAEGPCHNKCRRDDPALTDLVSRCNAQQSYRWRALRHAARTQPTGTAASITRRLTSALGSPGRQRQPQ